MWVLLTFIVLLALGYWYTYPRFGAWLFSLVSKALAKHAGLQAEIIELNGVPHHVLCSKSADKPMLLLIHGFTGNHVTWLRFAKYLTDDYFVVIPDLAGHGETGFNKNWDYSIVNQAAHMAALIKTLGYKEAHIVGNSMGGFIAAHIARYMPDNCASLTLISPAGILPTKPSPLLEMLKQGVNPFLISSDQDFSRFYSMVMARPPFAPKVVQKALSQQFQNRAMDYARIFSDYNNMNHILDQELKAIKCPAMLIWGALDKIIDVSNAEVWRRELNCTTHIWYDVGHMPMTEAPERTAFAVQAFIAKL